MRTVRRRVADLMIELGTDTRFPAGVEAAPSGWLRTQPTTDQAGGSTKWYAAAWTCHERCRSGP